MSESTNPFAAPLATDHLEDSSVTEPGSLQARVEAIRREHIKHEASVKSIALLYWLGSFLVGTGAIIALTRGTLATSEIIIAWLLLAYAVLNVIIGYGIHRLYPWGRMVGIVLSTAQLVAFPVGTLIHGYFLYLFLCAKGRMVFSPEYRQVIDMTPHIHQKTSWLVLGLLILLFILILAALVLPVIG